MTTKDGTFWLVSGIGMGLLAGDNFDDQAASFRRNPARWARQALRERRRAARNTDLIKSDTIRGIKQGLPESVAVLWASASRPPLKVMLASTDRVTRTDRQYWKELRKARKEHLWKWKYPLRPQDVEALKADCLNALDSYRSLAARHADTYMDTWIGHVLQIFREFEEDEATSGG